MVLKVGSKGQVVISKQIRDQLGVKSGWIALERLVKDHVEVYFLSPEHNRSLKASLAPYLKTKIASEQEFHKKREKVWKDTARVKMKGE